MFKQSLVALLVVGSMSALAAQAPTFKRKAGEAFAIPAGPVHNAVNGGTTQATIIATYLIEKGKPLATPAK